MQDWQALPPLPLGAGTRLGKQFRDRGVTDYRSAARYVAFLPYGRTGDREDFRSVLSEQRGTCSTKHALLAELARETGIPVRLMLGIYMMSEDNTPGVGTVLESCGLTSIPEAHCYLRYATSVVDVTRMTRASASSRPRFSHEEVIEPFQIGAYKLQVHRRFIRAWAESIPGLDYLRAWDIRERCIATLDETSEPAARAAGV